MNNFASLLIVLLFSSYLAGQDHLHKEVEKIIRFETDLDLKDFPHITILIIDGDSTHQLYFNELSDSLLLDDVLEVGSVTKPFMVTLVSILQEHGYLSYEDTIKQFIPELANTSIGESTIANLLYERYDCPRIPNNIGLVDHEKNNPYKYYTREMLMSYLIESDPHRTEQSNYSYIPYALLEYIVEQATNLSIEKALAKYLNQPLELQSTSFNNEVVTGYRRDGDVANVMTFKTFKTSLGLHTSLQDIEKLIRYNLSLIKTHRENNIPIIKTSLGKNIKRSLGWLIIDDLAKFKIYSFTGRSNGHRVEICFIPETETAVIIGSTSSIGTKGLPFHILRMINNNWKRI